MACTYRPKPSAVIIIGADGFTVTASKEFRAVFQYFGHITAKFLGYHSSKRSNFISGYELISTVGAGGDKSLNICSKRLFANFISYLSFISELNSNIFSIHLLLNYALRT